MCVKLLIGPEQSFWGAFRPHCAVVGSGRVNM